MDKINKEKKEKFCTHCGRKRRNKKELFCSHCGTEFDEALKENKVPEKEILCD